MNSQDLKVFVVSHKPFEKPSSSTYCSIAVGEANRIDSFDFYDNTNDNITTKNKNYCELTALYWIWKNIDCKYVGLVHYRRYFYHRYKSLFSYKLYSNSELQKILTKFDVILPIKSVVSGKSWKNVYEHYSHFHYKKDLDELVKIIKRFYPEYYDCCISVLQQKKVSLRNMIITSKKILNEYCNFLFGILFKLEAHIDISYYDEYQSRVYGFLSEYLSDVFFKVHSDYKIKYLPVCNTDDSPFKTYFLKFLGSIRRSLLAK